MASSQGVVGSSDFIEEDSLARFRVSAADGISEWQGECRQRPPSVHVKVQELFLRPFAANPRGTATTCEYEKHADKLIGAHRIRKLLISLLVLVSARGYGIIAYHANFAPDMTFFLHFVCQRLGVA